jgi:CRP/FNR family transcriptional regulator
LAAEPELLKSIPYFAGLGDTELEAVQRLTFERSLSRNEVVFLEGEKSEAMYFVVSGRVKIFKTSPEGKEQILRIMNPGDSFNDVPIFDGGPNPASAAALEPTLIYGIRGEDMRRLFWEYPSVATKVIEILALRLRHMVSLVEDLSFRQVTGRVAKVLLEQGEEKRLTQQEMAALVGTAREVVGRSLKVLEAEGAIRLDRHRIVLLDRSLLEEMTGVS